MSEDTKEKSKKVLVDNSDDDAGVVGLGLDQQLVDALHATGIENLQKRVSSSGPLSALIKSATGQAEAGAVKLAFYQDPIEVSDYAGLFKTKRKLLPDHALKLIRTQNHLIASILRARGNTMAMHGHKRRDRFDVGLEVNLKPEFEKYVKPEQMAKIRERIERATKLFLTCGSTEDVREDEKMSLSEFLDMQARNGLTFGKHATEIIYDSEGKDRKFHSFRPVDAGTIWNAARRGEYGAQGVRESAIKRIEELTNIKIDPKKLIKDEYSHIQVIDGLPVQAFSPDELVVYNLYPSTDIEHAGYPVTPIDTCISSVTTHLSIDAYNRLYFQNGRAAKGILVVKSNEIDQATLNKIRQDFVASINSVNNAFRAPVFGITPEDDVQWVPMVSNAGDGEFQFLYDQVARNILATFNMSPDELPGYGHLSRGTSQQSLSECLSQVSKILTPDGYISLGSLLKEDSSVNTMIWTGIKWSEGRVFKTGVKKLVETILKNHLSIKTSPDHKFQVINNDGYPEWKTQSEIAVGDYVLTNRKTVTGVRDVPKFEWLDGEDPEDLPLSTQVRYIKTLLESDLPRAYKKDLYCFDGRDLKKRLSVSKLRLFLTKANIEFPKWLENYRCHEVIEIIDHKTSEEMVDVTMYDDDHSFVANGIIVHNSSNEFKLTAARDTGLRPLILKFQSFLNDKIFPLIDEELAQICYVQLSGLDAQSREQESLRLQQDMPLHMTYDEVLGDVDKHPIGNKLGGNFPLNERYQIVADKMLKVSEMRDGFLEDPTALIDPMLQFQRDPFFLNYLNILMQANPAAVKAYCATKPYAYDMLLMMAQDYLEEDEEG